jgi:hypothetical protein
MTKAKQLTCNESGEIRRFPLENVWRPKLLMIKPKTLETIVYESLCEACDHWLETDYENKPDPGFLLFQLQRALKDEVEAAWKKFMAERGQS